MSLTKLWLPFGILLLIATIINPFVTNYTLVSLGIIIIHATVYFTSIYASRSKYKTILILALALRIFFVLWDIYGRNIFTLPHSGGDTEAFYRRGLDVMQSGYVSWSNLYSNVLAVLFFFIGPQRIVAQYLNALCGVSVIILIWKSFKLLRIPEKRIYLLIWIAALFPNSLSLSSILLREQLPAFFVAISLYFTIRWYVKPSVGLQIYSVLFLLIASAFHSGLIGILLGQFFLYIFYDHRTKRFTIKPSSLVIFIFTTVILYIIYFYFSDIFLRKFGSVGGIEDLVNLSNARRGGAQYLTSLSMNNPLQLILFSPIHMLYFLVAPLPMNWRGFSDIFAFFFDSSLYIYLIWLIIRKKYNYSHYRPLIIALLIMLVGTVFIFGIGVHNAGTAIRHRQKIISLVLLIIGLMQLRTSYSKT